MHRVRRIAVMLAAVVPVSLIPLSFVHAQQTAYTITGRTLDADGGAGLAGVQVSLRGTRFGAITDASGRYSIVAQLAKGRYVLEAITIGRETQRSTLVLDDATAINVPDLTMRSTALALEELVVTGTAAPTARRSLGNAVSTVSGEQLTESPALTIDQALQGKVAGATITSNTGNPGGGVSIRLRGTSSIVGGAEPLYIVDGVIIDNNGEQQINFGYRSNPSNRLADLDPNDIERMEILKGAAAAALYGSRANNGVVQIFTKRGRAGLNRVVIGSRMTRNDLERQIDFALTPKDTLGNTVTRYNHQDLLFRQPWNSDTYLSASGGNNDTQYYVSANFVNENGVMLGSDHQKLNVRMNLDQRLWNWLTVAAGANYIRTHNNLVINGENSSGGLLTAIAFTPTTLDLAARDPVTGLLKNQLAGSFANPLYVLENWHHPQQVNRFVGSFQARANPIQKLRLEYRLGYDQYTMETSQSIPRGDIVTALGSASLINRSNLLVNNDVVGSYEIGNDRVQVTTSAGVNHTYQQVHQLNATATDLTPLIKLVRGAVQTASESEIELVTLGIFGQQQIGFDNRWFLTGAIRWDASSTFGHDERWQLYPKLSGSWVASEESFVKNSLPWVSELRLRAALGYAGNQPPLAEAYTRVSRFTGITNINRIGLVPMPTAGNPNLKPERQREWEAGADVAIFNNRLGTRFTYYNQYVHDLLLTRPFVPSAGYVSVLQNVGELSNTGIELEINTSNINKSNFVWNSRFIYSRNANRIEKLNVAPFTAGYTNLVMEGQPVGVHFMPAYKRDEHGKILKDTAAAFLGFPILENTPGPIPTSNNRIVGNPWPDFTASLFNEFRLGKNWTASMLLDGSFGAELWNQTQRIMDGSQAGPLYDKRLRGEITTAQLNRVRSVWEAYLEDASYVKLRDVTVRYSTDARWLRNIGASRAEFELVARNLHTWTDYTGYDPEINMFGLSTIERGTDFAVYPNPRTVGVGVRLTY